MIRKLLKYDIRGMGKKLLPLYGLALALSIINKLNDMLFVEPLLDGTMVRINQWTVILSKLLMGVYIMTILAVFAITFFMLVSKYNKSVYGDEGYLTHTLPISQSQIIISKALNFLFWTLISSLVALISFFILGFRTSLWKEFLTFWREFTLMFGQFIRTMQTYNKVALVIFIVTGLIYPLVEILQIFLSIGLGNKFRHKIAAGVVAYLGISFLVSTLTAFVTNKMAFSVMAAPDMNSAYHYVAEPNALPLMASLFVLSLGQLVVFFLATKYIQEKHLNLE